MKKQLVVTLGLVATIGCSAAAPEPEGATQSKLLAPNPTLNAPASTTTESALGVVSWRVYKGKESLILTGYDRSGQAAGGLMLRFVHSTPAAPSHVTVSWLDGSGATARVGFRGPPTRKGAPSPAITALLERAEADFRVIQQKAAGTGMTLAFGGGAGGLHIASGTESECLSSWTDTMLAGIGCAGTTAAAALDWWAVAATCGAAAKSVVGTQSNCPLRDPNDTCDPYSEGKGLCSSGNYTGQPGGPIAGGGNAAPATPDPAAPQAQPATPPASDPQPADPSSTTMASASPAAAPPAADPAPSENAADQASDASCASCPAGAADVSASPSDGAVASSDSPSADAPADAPSDSADVSEASFRILQR